MISQVVSNYLLNNTNNEDMKRLTTLTLLITISLITSVPSFAEKGQKNTKKADVKRVAREEHQVVKNWANLHKKNADKKKKIKKQFD